VNSRYLNNDHDEKKYNYDENTKLRLAHAYIPFQQFGEIYHPKEALCKGTLFKELYMPYKY
jgi:hypothetical protein